ncbi:MAG: 6-phosphogluconolactonase, partial [Desulfobacterales bacterium]|nr:6-phosphogluconolactonase [Desulfobacterales bacterium]
GARLFDETARKCVEEGGRFFVALSGGSTPRAMHRMLAQEPYHSEIPWHGVHLFWVDERCVPADDAASNYGAARDDFLERIPLPAGQVHPMAAGKVPEDGALEYQGELVKVSQPPKGQIPIFDLIFLGLGKDGHTASLFPGQKALDERERLVVAVKGGDPDVHRLTMTYPVLNKAKIVVFTVSGGEKAPIVKAILDGSGKGYPAQQIQPAEGRLIWLLDREATSLL